MPASAAERPAPSIPAKVFITGANGFIAKHLAARLRELGAQVSGVDLNAAPAENVVAGSILEPTTWADQLAGIDIVIHTAAIVSNAAPLDEAWTVNVAGTHRVLKAAIDAGVPRFMQVSSIVAYGLDFPDGVTESDPTRVSGYSYIDTKLNAENIVLAAHAAGTVAATIVRPGDVWGPGSRPWTIIPLQMIAKRQLVLPAGGRGVFSPVYIDNLVDGIVLAATSSDAIGQIFNLTDGYGISCAEFFGALARMAGRRVPTVPTPVALALARILGTAQRRFGIESELTTASIGMLSRTGTYSIEKARTVLGYRPIVSFDDGMARVREWARAEGLIR